MACMISCDEPGWGRFHPGEEITAPRRKVRYAKMDTGSRDFFGCGGCGSFFLHLDTLAQDGKVLFFFFQTGGGGVELQYLYFPSFLFFGP